VRAASWVPRVDDRHTAAGCARPRPARSWNAATVHRGTRAPHVLGDPDDAMRAAALTALKRKKLIDAQVEKVSASKMTLEQQRMALEQVNISKVTFDAIDAGKRELERLNKEMGVERVEETMDELEEQIELQNETADALARPLNAFGVGEDEDELQRELEELEQATLDEHVLKIDATAEVDSAAAVNAPAAPSSAVPAAQKALPAMPAAPTTKVVETEEERELRMLEESMAM